MINHYIICSCFAWITTQLFKFFSTLIIKKKVDFTRLVGAGGMPSSHAAFTCSLTALLLCVEGIASSAFAVAFVFSCVVIYDATGVRRETGRQAKLLNIMVEEWTQHGSTANFGKRLKELIGHTKLEVTVGVIYGVIVGVAYYLLFLR
ncbi:MAG: divergent PAP2 family protein [Clostridia bacterium]|nr:divergent PAP2 family protein [Clostridia bacterium]